MKNKILFLLLALIFSLGAFLRLYGLNSSPPSLNWDEAAFGYNAYSILQTGQDEYGVSYPLFIRSFDDYKSAISAYLMIPAIYMFGLNETGVRSPGAFLGSLSILLIFLITKKLFASIEAALFASFAFAIEPWSVHFSRILPDVSNALFFLLSGLTFFVYSEKHRFFIPLSLLFFILSAFSYNTNKALIPTLILIILILNRKTLYKLKKSYLYLSTFLLTIYGALFFYYLIQGELFARVKNTNIFSLWPTITDSLTTQHSLPYIVDLIIHNKLFYFLWELGARYLGYFSPANLFLREPLEPSTIIAGNSMFHPFEFVLWLTGLIFLIKNYNKYPLTFFLILISPIPAVFTWNYFIPYRAVTLFAVFSILIGVGFSIITNHLSKYKALRFIVTIFFVTMGICSSLYLFDSIQVLLPYRDSGNWQPGLRETVRAIPENYLSYKEVIIDTPQAQPYIFYLFYSKYPPHLYQKEPKNSQSRDFGNFKFKMIYWPKDRYLHNYLFIGDEFNLPQKDIDTQKNARVVKIIKNKNGDQISKIVALD